MAKTIQNACNGPKLVTQAEQIVKHCKLRQTFKRTKNVSTVKYQLHW